MNKSTCELTYALVLLFLSLFGLSCSDNKTANIDQSNLPRAPGPQYGWRWCLKCQGMWYSQNDSASVCPAGGEHSRNESGHYYHYYGSITGAADYYLSISTCDSTQPHGNGAKSVWVYFIPVMLLKAHALLVEITTIAKVGITTYFIENIYL